MPGRVAGRRAGRKREGDGKREGKGRSRAPADPMTYAQYAVAFAASFSAAFSPTPTTGTAGTTGTDGTGGSIDAPDGLEGELDEERPPEKGAVASAESPANYAQTRSSGSLFSFLCGARHGKEVPEAPQELPRPQELPFEEPAFLLVCPSGHDLEKTRVDMQCSNCTTRIHAAMYCQPCEWGVCSQCYNAMCVAKPRKIPLREGRMPKPPSSRSVGASPPVTLSLELTLDDLLQHGMGLREWFDAQLYLQAVEKGVRVSFIPLLEQSVRINDAQGRVYDSYLALMHAGVNEEALPIVFKFDTERAMSQVSKSSLSSAASPSRSKASRSSLTSR